MTDQPINRPYAGAGHATAIAGGDARAWVGPVFAIFITSLLLPGMFTLPGNVSVNASRLLMLVAIIPLTMAWLNGQAGRIIVTDILLASFALWMVVVYARNHGMERVPYGIMTGIELMGGYLMGRILIRSPEDFRRFFACMFVALLVLLPFALYELRTGRAIMQDLAQSIYGSSYRDIRHPPRAGGFYRVQSVFEHPILFGLFCSLAVVNLFFVWQKFLVKALMGAGLALFLTFASLSSGPFLAAQVQLGLLLWGKLTRNNWRLILILVASAYVFLTFASNRGPLLIVIETFTFNPMTGWWRIHIFDYGMQNVWANPIFGLGLRDWARPSWLTSSVDNFWLLMAMRFGVVGFLLLATGMVLHVWNIIRQRGMPDLAVSCRTGYMIGLVGLGFSLATVHIWGPTFVLSMFYVGAGAWLYTSEFKATEHASAEAQIVQRARRSPVLRRPPAVHPAVTRNTKHPAVTSRTSLTYVRPRTSADPNTQTEGTDSAARSPRLRRDHPVPGKTIRRSPHRNDDRNP